SVTEDRGDDDERREPGPDRHACKEVRATRRHLFLRGPTVTRKPDLVQLTRELRGERRPRLDTDLGRSVRDLGDDGVGNARPSCGVLERGRVLLGNPAEVVLPFDVRTRCI